MEMLNKSDDNIEKYGKLLKIKGSEYKIFFRRRAYAKILTNYP